jgi:hypothetical protein
MACVHYVDFVESAVKHTFSAILFLVTEIPLI